MIQKSGILMFSQINDIERLINWTNYPVERYNRQFNEIYSCLRVDVLLFRNAHRGNKAIFFVAHFETFSVSIRVKIQMTKHKFSSHELINTCFIRTNRENTNCIVRRLRKNPVTLNDFSWIKSAFMYEKCFHVWKVLSYMKSAFMQERSVYAWKEVCD